MKGNAIEVLSVRERVGRMIMAGTLALSLGAGFLAAPTMAMAAEQGSVTISAADGQAVTYNAYQVFKADVQSNGKAQHIEWASDAVKSAVEGVLKAPGQTPAYTGTTAQDALEYINANWGTSDATRIVESSDFPNKLADALDGTAVSGTVTPGTAATFDEGWYLFTTTPASLGTGEMGTSAIFAQVNKDVAVNITEKTSLPTIAKQVKEDATGALGTKADANKGQEMDYVLTGTVAKNVESFADYFYEFEDTMTGIEVVPSSVVVKIDGTAVTTGADVQASGGSLKVTFADLKAAKAQGATDPIAINDDTQVTVEYKAKLTADAVIGAAGNPNTAKVNYYNNPNTTSKGSTVEVQNKLFTYQLELVKVDKDNVAKTLSGAKITIQVAAGAPDGNGGKYVQADGSLGNTAYEFTTDGNGKISVPRIDEGTYILHETTPPTGFAAWDSDITLTVTPTFDATSGALTGLAGTMSGGEGDANTKVLATDAATGKVSIQATDDKELDMPLTGEQGTMLVTLAGVGIVAISLAGLYRSRKKDEGEGGVA